MTLSWRPPGVRAISNHSSMTLFWRPPGSRGSRGGQKRGGVIYQDRLNGVALTGSLDSAISEPETEKVAMQESGSKLPLSCIATFGHGKSVIAGNCPSTAGFLQLLMTPLERPRFGGPEFRFLWFESQLPLIQIS